MKLKVLFLIILLNGCTSVLPPENLPPSCQFCYVLSNNPLIPRTFLVHQSAINCNSSYQITNIFFITNLPVGFNSPDGGLNWFTYLVINGNRKGRTTTTNGLQTGLWYPVALTETEPSRPNVILPVYCSQVYTTYSVAVGFAFVREAVVGTNLIDRLLVDGEQFWLRIDLCETAELNSRCIQSQEELVTVVIDRQPSTENCSLPIRRPVWPDPGPY